jgi:5-methylcytosine-specific restriction enzyme subunit McrC
MFKLVGSYRNNLYYQFAINICHLLHQSLLPNENLAGKWDFVDLMDDERAMNRIFENFLMNFYKQECRMDYPDIGRSHIRFQLTPLGLTFAKSTDEAFRLLPVMETDMTLYNPRTKKKIILDAKYYKETLATRYGEGGKIRREHLSQILTYVMNQENDNAPHTKETKGILVYPTIDKELDVSYVYKDTNHVIRVSTVNLNQDWQMIEQRLKEIIKDQKQ